MIKSLSQKCLIVAILIFTSAELQALDIYLVRHFEKQSDSDDPELTQKGHARAQALAKHFQNIPLAAIYSTAYKRTQQTAAPLAQNAQYSIFGYSPRELQAFANTLIENQQAVLVVGHSNTTPALIKALGGPDFAIAEDEYGMLYHVYESDGEVNMHAEFIRLIEGSVD